MAQLLRTIVVITAAVHLAGPPAFAQEAAPVAAPTVREHFGFGGAGAVGFPGPMATVRLSAPLAPRVGLDVDVGRARQGDRAASAFGAFVRWLRTERRSDGTSDYGILGVLVVDTFTRVDIRFPNQRILREERHRRLTGQFGYGADWQAPNGARVGLEVAGGGSEMTGPRLYARAFAVWGPAARR